MEKNSDDDDDDDNNKVKTQEKLIPKYHSIMDMDIFFAPIYKHKHIE